MPNRNLTGSVLNQRYRLGRVVGVGGMGEVYEAVDETLDRKVAIKVLLRKFARDEKFRARFLREAKSASKVRHPNVVQITDFGEHSDGSVFLVMEFLEGRDLRQLLQDERALPWPRTRHILLQIVSAIGATHDLNIIHRDIKPANFFVANARGFRDFIKLLDFGIAKLAAESTGAEKALTLTGTGEVMGTVKYMAPEQAYGQADDRQVDVYAVGIVAYEMLTGRVPFRGESVFEILKKHVDEPPRPLREIDPSIPAAAEAMVLRALAKPADQRFASMDEMEAAISEISAEEAVRSHDGGTTVAERTSAPSPIVSASMPPSVAERSARPIATPHGVGRVSEHAMVDPASSPSERERVTVVGQGATAIVMAPIHASGSVSPVAPGRPSAGSSSAGSSSAGVVTPVVLGPSGALEVGSPTAPMDAAVEIGSATSSMNRGDAGAQTSPIVVSQPVSSSALGLIATALVGSAVLLGVGGGFVATQLMRGDDDGSSAVKDARPSAPRPQLMTREGPSTIDTRAEHPPSTDGGVHERFGGSMGDELTLLEVGSSEGSASGDSEGSVDVGEGREDVAKERLELELEPSGPKAAVAETRDEAPKGPSKAECERARAITQSAQSARRWNDVLEHTRSRACWTGARDARRRFRVEALAENKHYAKCIKAGGRSSDPEVEVLVRWCKKRLDGSSSGGT